MNVDAVGRATRCLSAIVGVGLAATCSALIGTGCDADRQASATSAASAGSSDEARASAARSAVATATSSATPRDERVGRWTASYRATQTKVEVPRGLPAKTWQQDDGAANVGEGRIELVVADDLTVQGSSEGSLGKLALRGVVDDDVLRVGLAPRDPTGEPAFGGVLVAKLEGDVFVGQLRASNGDGSVVRESQVRISRPETFRAPAPASAAPPASRPLP